MEESTEITGSNEITESNEIVENKDPVDNSAQFNIIETNISPTLVSNFSSDILVHIFKYCKITGSIDLSSEYENILMSKKINIIEYLNEKLGCRDVYDIKCTGVRIKKIDDNIRKKISQWLMHDEKYYVSFYFYIATPGSLFEAYLLVITGKKNAVMAEQLTIVENTQKTTNSTITDIQTQVSISADEINKQENLHVSFVKEVQSFNNNTTNQLTTLKSQIVEDIENISMQFTNSLNTTRTENEKILHDLKQQLTTNAVDTHSTIKDILSAIDTKIESITKMFKSDMNSMLGKFNEEVQNINKNLNTQESSIIKLQEIALGILRSEGDNYVVVK
jgi:hypothetical protein